MTYVRTLTDADKLLLRVALLNAGIKARVRTIRNGLRVVFEGDKETVRNLLNEEGFLHAAGQEFGPHSFNGANEVFVRYARP